MAFMPADRLALGTLQAALSEARHADDGRPALEVLAGSLLELGVRATPSARSGRLIARDREAWLRRLQSARRSESTVAAYRIAIDELLAWAAREARTGELFDEQAIVDHLDDYRQRLGPAPATYHRRFLLLRHFMRWVSHRNGAPDPFLELQAPPKPRQESDWLTREEFAALLDAAEHPARRRSGLVERDQLVLLTLAMTGLRRSELIALDWRDVTLDGPRPSLLVRQGKGGRPRRQPLPAELARRLSRWRAQREASASDPVFCGLGGARLQPTILAGIIHRTATRAGIDKHVTAHTHCATRRRRGCARPQATRAWSPSISGTQTCPRWPATRTSLRRSCTPRLEFSPRTMAHPPRRARRAGHLGETGVFIPDSSRPGTDPCGDPPRLLEMLSRCGALPGAPGRPRRAVP